MPDVRAGLQFSLLLLALPAQYLIMNYSNKPATPSDNPALKQLVLNAQQFGVDLFSWQSWEKWCVNLIYQLQHPHSTNSSNPWATSRPALKDGGESPAVEVMHFDDPQGHFTTSPHIRSPRPPNINLRVGQVVKHRLWGYSGVIIGWDEIAKAPEEWINEMHKDHPDWRRQPNFALLVDVRDRPHPQITYVPEQNLKLVTKTKVIHPYMTQYFDYYDGSKYIPRPALKQLYPDD